MKQTLTPDRGRNLAIDLYRKGRPVIVFSIDETLLHGSEDLQSLVDINATLECTVLRIEATFDDWDSSEWPEIFEAVRQLWLKGALP